VLLRRDAFHRFYSCLVFVPREKYNTQVRQRIENVIREAFSAHSMESQVQIAESNLARIHIVARTKPSDEIHIDTDALERRVAAAVRSWSDGFKTALLSRFDEAYALQLFEKYAQAFPEPTPRTLAATPPPSTCRSSRPSRKSRRACILISTDPSRGARTSSS
jgi:glutamate dehydrogenase